MSASVVAMPVSVEQIAAAIQQMSLQERQRLLALVPELRASGMQSPAAAAVEPEPAWLVQLRMQVLAALGGQPLSLDEPFLGDLTIAQYDGLTEQEKDELWDRLAGIDLMEMEELEVSADAVPA